MAKKKYDDYVKPYLDRIPKWRRQGLTEKQVAEKLGIGKSTLEEYKKLYPDFLDALKKGRAELIEELEDSLYKKAKGYEYEETKTYITKSGEGKDAKATQQRVERTKKHVPPDSVALFFALKNLAPENWKDKSELKVGGDKENPLEVIQVYIPDNGRDKQE